jgi:hypothetical protein
METQTTRFAPPLGNGEAPGERTIEIRGPDRRVLMCRIKSVTPLLTNKVSEFALRKIAGEKLTKEEEAKNSTPQALFEASIYRDAEGRPAFPAAGIRKAMVRSGTSEDKKMTHLLQFFNITQELVPVLASEPTLRKDMVRNANARGALCLAYRAEYKQPWAMIVPIRYNANAISAKDVIGLLNLAGFAVGIGCWRPEKGGIFGQFEVEEVEEIR